MPSKKLKVSAHAALFLVAFVVFYVGLGVGLQVSPAWGTTLWVVAIVLAVLNILWIVWSRARAKR